MRYIHFNTLYFWLGILGLIIINLIWIPVFRIAKGWTKKTLTVKKSINRTSDALNYIIAYIIAFLGFQFDKWQDWVALIILLTTIFFIYIHSNLIFVNPLLNIWGYKIYDVEVMERGHLVVITKKSILKEDEKIQLKSLSDNIYLEAI
ncbi:MAG: hypothetical protein QW478_02855 [Candidatus Micrarchaeaceae archaeon]